MVAGTQVQVLLGLPFEFATLVSEVRWHCRESNVSCVSLLWVQGVCESEAQDVLCFLK
jgi:hypothetical protein